MKSSYPSFDDQRALARELAREALAFLECRDRRLVNNLSLQIGRAMFQYVGLTAAQAQWKPTKQQREILKRLQRQVSDVRRTIHDLNPEYRRAIGNLTGLPDKKRIVSLRDVDEQLRDVAASTNLVSWFLTPPAGRRRNHALEAAIRRLLPTFERLAGDTAIVVRDKPAGRPPQPGTLSLRALVRTLRKFPSPPTQTAILNMVDQVQTNPESEMYDVEAEIVRHFMVGDAPSPTDCENSNRGVNSPQ